MRSSRLLSILLRLLLRGRIIAAELAREFEVAVRTVYRDLDALSAAGVPVHAERGRGGGIVLAPGRRTQVVGLTGPEARSVPLAGLHSAARDLGLAGEAADEAATVARRHRMRQRAGMKGSGAFAMRDRPARNEMLPLRTLPQTSNTCQKQVFPGAWR